VVNADDELPAPGSTRKRRLMRLVVAFVVLAALLYLPAFEFYIRATSYAAESNTMKLWSQRVGLHSNLYPSEPLFPVTPPSVMPNRFRYIDTAGNVIIPGPFLGAMDFSEGLAAVSVDVNGEELWGYIDTAGAFQIKPFLRNRPERFQDGLALAAIGERGHRRFGYIDQSGDWQIEPRFRSASSFVDGIAVITIRPPSSMAFQLLAGDWCPEPHRRFIDTTGHRLKDSDLRDFDMNDAEPVPVVYKATPQSTRVEYQNGDGVNVFGKSFHEGTQYFQEGLAGIKSNGLWGFIDNTGQFVIQPQYQHVGMFNNGYASATPQGAQGTGLIDQQGNMIIPPIYNDVYKFRDGLAWVSVGKNRGRYPTLINLKNEQIWPPVNHIPVSP